MYEELLFGGLLIVLEAQPVKEHAMAELLRQSMSYYRSLRSIPPFMMKSGRNMSSPPTTLWMAATRSQS